MYPSLAMHVGDWIRTELLEPHNIRVNAVAEHFGVSRQSISALLNGRARLSAVMAIRFEKAFGISAEMLMRMQSTFDLAQARILNTSKMTMWRAVSPVQAVL